MTLYYTLQFFDYWHISSGLSGGSRLDGLVIKDGDGLPYVAGKIIKGLAREMAELLGDNEFVKECFGSAGIDMGKCYFTNATLEQNTAKQITTNKLQDNLYDIIASTKIGENGIAEDKSLREIEVVVPLTLCGEIRDIPNQESFDKMTQSLTMIKRMGLNRNRGLGRCEFIVEERK
jgi:hypothetical protein